MEHLINLTLAISDDDIEREVNRQMVKAAKDKVENALHDRCYYSSDSKVIELAKEQISIFITENSDEIIAKAAEALAASLPKRQWFRNNLAKEMMNHE